MPQLTIHQVECAFGWVGRVLICKYQVLISIVDALLIEITLHAVMQIQARTFDGLI